MKVVLDTNILLDFALGRPGLVESSGQVLAWCVDRPGTGLVASQSLATLSYMLGRSAGRAKVRAFIRDLSLGLTLAVVGDREVLRALDLPLTDFEDALIAAAAESAGAKAIVTRNVRDFRRSPVPAMTPEDFLA